MNVGVVAIERPAARVPHHRGHDFARADAVEQLVLVIVEELEIRLAGDERGTHLIHERAVRLRIAVKRERVLAGRERERHQRRTPQSDGGFAFEVRPAQIGIVGNLGALGVDHEAIGAPQVWHSVHLAVDRGVLADDVQKFGLKLVQLELGEIEGLVDAEFTLCGHDAILGRLREIVAGAPRCAELGDHFFVVRQGQFHVEARLFLECGDQVGGHVVGPADDAQLLAAGLGRAGPQTQGEYEPGCQEVFHRYSLRVACCAKTAFFVGHCQNSLHLTEFWDRLPTDTPGKCRRR